MGLSSSGSGQALIGLVELTLLGLMRWPEQPTPRIPSSYKFCSCFAGGPGCRHAHVLHWKCFKASRRIPLAEDHISSQGGGVRYVPATLDRYQFQSRMLNNVCVIYVHLVNSPPCESLNGFSRPKA